MPLQNRVDPFGAIAAVPERGLFYGNRGGGFHRADKTLRPRPWASRQWLCCVLAFKGRRRAPLMGRGYTELFFLDEVTALAAGHRPCFYCRREAAQDFQRCFAKGNGLATAPAPRIDKLLHAERHAVTGDTQPLRQDQIRHLPDGTVIAVETAVLALKAGQALPWDFSGYGEPRALPAHARLLTPPSTIAALRAGYAPAWHPSARA